MTKACEHLRINPPAHAPSGVVCAECVAMGSHWVHLRMCTACGHIGCCDSSPNKHATAHFAATKHPVIQSAEQGEFWRWCYVHEQMADL